MQDKQKALSYTWNFLAANSQVSSFIRAHDWSDSPLGSPEEWSSCLKTTVAIMLPAAAQIVVFWGEEYVALYNDTYAPTIGDKHPHALGRPAREYWTELWDDLEPLLNKVRSTGETVSARDRPFYIERHGYPETVFFDISYSPVRDEDGLIAGVLCIVNETTQRVQSEVRQREAEAVLRESEQRQTFLLRLSDALQPSGTVSEIQAAACHIVGEHLQTDRTYYAELDFMHQLAIIEQDYVRGDASSLVGTHPLASFGPLLDAIRQGQPFIEDDTQNSTRISDADRPAYLSRQLGSFIAVPLIKTGELVAAFCVTNASPRQWNHEEVVKVQEVAERTWAAIAKARAEDAIKTALKQKDSFLAVASHELKTPVTSAKAFAEVLERRFRRAGDEKNAILLGKIRTQMDKLTLLIRDLLDASRLEVGMLPYQEELFSFDDLVDDIIEDVQRTISTHHIQRDGVTQAMVFGDRDRIGQVLINLLTNAVKYSPNSSSVLVNTSCTQQDVTLCVQDSGIGIAKEKLPHVFERFFREMGIQEETFPGLGLGLYVSAEIIQRHGGTIWASSEKGSGSTFYFRLPLQREQPGDV